MILLACHRIFRILFMILLCSTLTLARHFQKRDTIDGYKEQVTLIRNYLNTSVKPCDNLYEYTCGQPQDSAYGFGEEFVLDFYTKSLDDLYAMDLKWLLESDNEKLGNRVIFNKLKNFYESCKKVEVINIDRYLEIIKPSEEYNWPLDGEDWQPKGEWSIWSAMGKLANYGFNHLFFTLQWEVDSHTKDFSGKLSPFKIEKAQVEFVRNQLNSTVDKSTIARLKKVLEFMDNLKNLYEISVDPEEESIQMTKDLFNKDLMNNLDTYVMAYLGGEGEFKGITWIHSSLVKFLPKLQSLMEVTPKDVLIETLKQMFRFYLSQQLSATNTDSSCIETLRKLTPLALDHVYDMAIYSKEKQKTEEVIGGIFLALKTRLAQIIKTEHSELPPGVLNQYVDKCLAMKLNFGQLPSHVEEQFYVDYFQSWEVVKDDFYGNHVRALKHHYFTKLHLLNLDKFAPLRKLYGPVDTMPTYLLHSNTVVIPFAYIRYPIFLASYNDIFLYTEIGNSMGRAMLHGFIGEGLKYDKTGQRFDECQKSCPTYPKQLHLEIAANCLKMKYNLNSLQLEEKIADINGFRLAYDSYFQGHRESIISSDVEFSEQQVFILKFVSGFCHNHHHNHNQQQGEPSVRITHIMENFAEFQEIFSCPRATDAVATGVCKVW